MSAPPTGVLFNEPRAKPLSTVGLIQPGAYYQFFQTQTLTPTNVYADGGLLTPLSQTPGTGGTTAASDGRLVPIYLNPATTYRVQLFSVTNVLLEDVDPYVPVSVPSQGQIGIVIYPLTTDEIQLSVVPTNFGYPADPYVDPRRYGADPAGNADSTVAVQTAINVAYHAKGVVWIGNNCNFSVGALSLTMSGNHLNDGFRIMGSMVNGSKLTQRGTPSALLTIQGATGVQEAPLLLENFSIACSGKTCDGLVLAEIGEWTVRKVYISGAACAIRLTGSLIGSIENCELGTSNFGLFARQGGGGSPPNLIYVRNSRIISNTSWGVDFNDGDNLTLEGNDIESNGTSTVLTTGGVHLGNNLQSSNGFAHNAMYENWIENNLGWSVLVDAQTGGSLVDLVIEGGKIIAAQAGNAINILGGFTTRIASVASPSPGDTWNITSTFAVLENVNVSVLNGVGIIDPTYTNVATSAQNFPFGRKDSFTGTGTGFSGAAPTGGVVVYQQGNQVTLEFTASITGTSNSAACTITGLPSKYWPASDSFGVLTTQDAGANSALPCQIAAATGIITIGFGHTFTGSGGKGVVGGSVTFRH